jgi:outer membrane protein insertion porin family
MMKRKSGVVVLGMMCCASVLHADIIRKVNVRPLGKIQVDEAMVRACVAAREGQELDSGLVKSDVRELLATGRFSDVLAEVESGTNGAVLVYSVRMKYKLTQPVRVTGAEALGSTKVIDLLGLKPGDFLDNAAVAARVVALKEEYRKRSYAFATVNWSLSVADEKAGLVTLSIDIREGDQRSVRKVKFAGCKAVEVSALNEAMNIPAWYNPLGWFRRTPYDLEDLRAGCERIRGVYKDRGYLDVEIGKPQISEIKPGKFDITISLREGISYRVSRMVVTGATLFQESVLLGGCGLKIGDVASDAQIVKAAGAIRDYYESRGYMGTAANYRLDLREKEGDVDVRFTVTEGRLTTIRNVLIHGNSTTKDKVIRRELQVYPGQRYDGVKVRQSESKLRNLNFFENVIATAEPTAVPERSDLVFSVDEKPTGQFMAGAGFSSIDKLVGFVEISQGNFDLGSWPPVGGGQKAKLRAEGGSTREDYTLSFVEPWFLDRQLALSLDLYSQRHNNRDYDVQRQGGALGLGVPLAGPNRLDLKYRLESVNIKNVDDTNAYEVVNNGERTEFFFSEPERVASSLAATWTRDTRDNFFLPTRGSRTFFSSTLMGGPLGFDTDLYDLEVGSTIHFPLWWGHVLSVRGRAEVVDMMGDSGDDQVPLSERLFAGGARTIRGFRYRWIGPIAERADGTGETRPCGGQTLMLASAEYSMPIGVPKFRLAGFYDIGNVAFDPYDFDFGSLSAGAGIGLRLDIPGFPIRFDYAWPVMQADDRARTENVSFWIGYGF